MNRRLALLVAISACLTGCGPSPPKSFVSPDGKRTLTTVINQSRTDPTKYLCVKFKITDASGKVEFEHQTGVSDVMRWSIAWEGNDKFMLRSSDIGNQAWWIGRDGLWHETYLGR
jgi:hypothetical protein